MNIAPAQAERPMHRTDIEGFGHHEDRLEMEYAAGRLPLYSTTGGRATTLLPT